MRDLKSCRVFVTPTTYGKNDPRLRTELELAVGEVVYNQCGRPLGSAELSEMLRGGDGYIAGLDTIDRALLACLAVLRGDEPQYRVRPRSQASCTT